MRSPSEMVLKAFLSRCPPEKKRKLEGFLPPEEKYRIEHLPTFQEELSTEEFTNGGLLEHVHWSWFLPTLKTYSEREQKLFLSSMSPLAAQNIGQSLNLSPPFEEISETARSYLRQILQNSLIAYKGQLLPVDYLPSSPLKKLLNLSKKDLTRLIDLLSLYDLAAELRQIVETKILKKIYSFLNEEEKKRLKQIASNKEPFPVARLSLERWDGSEETLRVHLHRRGLARLGLALSGQDPDLIWYICHQLDIGRGNALFKLCASEPTPGISEAMIREIDELIGNL
ncbi:MAG: hypothetical protein JSS32_00090 [Verrucomicrobia bacterium]|nr:hypothetical protein [Verrucomicrobiota bacterium]